jgi:Protein of unknown function (DUF1761)
MIMNLNYMAIFVAAILYMVIGSIYYSPFLFGKIYFKLSGVSMTGKMKGYEYPVQFIAALIQVYVLAHFLAYAGAVSWIGGMTGGFWAWLGFIATTTISGFLWERKPFASYLLANGYMLLVLLVAGAIIGAWR